MASSSSHRSDGPERLPHEPPSPHSVARLVHHLELLGGLLVEVHLVHQLDEIRLRPTPPDRNSSRTVAKTNRLASVSHMRRRHTPSLPATSTGPAKAGPPLSGGGVTAEPIRGPICKPL